MRHTNAGEHTKSVVNLPDVSLTQFGGCVVTHIHCSCSGAFPNICIFNLNNTELTKPSLSQLNLSLNSCIRCISAPTSCPASSTNKFGSTVNSSGDGDRAGGKSLCIFTLDGASHRSRPSMFW